MHILGSVHTALAIGALIVGALMLLQQKGGSRHRVLGHLYSGYLLLLNLSALSVYEQSSGPGPFHVLALVSLATLAGGFVPALLRYPRHSWLELHAYFMSWSYVGLVAAGGAQLATQFIGPGSPPVVISSVVVVLVGAILIHGRVPRALSSLGGDMVRPDDLPEQTPRALPRNCRR